MERLLYVVRSWTGNHDVHQDGPWLDHTLNSQSHPLLDDLETLPTERKMGGGGG